jgi:hypothetical protein
MEKDYRKMSKLAIANFDILLNKKGVEIPPRG